MDFIIASLRGDWEAFLAFSPRLLYATVVLVAFVVVGNAGGQLIARLIRRTMRLAPNAVVVTRLVRAGCYFVGILLALGVMGFTGIAASLLATGGVVAIVLGFAFREIGENLLAGIFLTFSRPFDLGDLIMTDGLTGRIRSIDIRSVHIRTADACDVFVPSAQIFRQPLYNYTRDGLRRPNFSIGIAYDDAPEAVIALLEETVRGVSDVLAEPGTEVVVKEFAANYVEYDVRFWMDTHESARGIARLTNDVKIHCWRALREAGMTFSTDVTTGLELKSAPPLRIEGAAS